MENEISEKIKQVMNILILLGTNSTWDLARPLAIFIHNSKNIDVKLLDAILEIVGNAISDTKCDIKKQKLIDASNILVSIKQKEQTEIQKEKEDIENMINNLN